MMFNDRQIEESDLIRPFINRKVGDGSISYGLSSAGYDVRLARRFYQYFGYNDSRSFDNDGEIVIDPKDVAKNPGRYGYYFDYVEDRLIIPPRGFLLGRTVERFELPENVIADAISKSTYVRVGIFCPITPLEPGWQGYLTLEIANLLDRSVFLYVNEGIVQVRFTEIEQPDNAYGDGKYQNQPKDVVLPYVK